MKMRLPNWYKLWFKLEKSRLRKYFFLIQHYQFFESDPENLNKKGLNDLGFGLYQDLHW